MEYDVPGWSTKQLVGMLKQMLFWEDPQIISFNLAGQPTDALLHALRGSENWNVFVTVAMENSVSARQMSWIRQLQLDCRFNFLQKAVSHLVTFQCLMKSRVIQQKLQHIFEPWPKK